MGRPVVQHRIGRYRFLDIQAGGGHPVAVTSNEPEEDVWRVESVFSERVYALKTIALKHLTRGQMLLLKEHLSEA